MSYYNKLNLIIDLPSPIEEKGLKSARTNTYSIKDKFNFFLNRKDIKRSSDLSDASSCLSGDHSEEFKSAKKVKKLTYIGLNNLIKDVKSPFSLFEENIKETGGLSHRLSNTKINKNKFGKRLSNQNNININVNNYFTIEDKTNLLQNFKSDLPSLIQEEIKTNLELKLKNNKESFNEINSLFAQYKNNTIEFKNLKENYFKLNIDLKEVKQMRNKLIAEKVTLTNELDFFKVNFYFIILF